MDKIVYDSLYKFLVSIGIILISLPFIVVGLMYGIEPTLISQEDYDILSKYSKDELLSRETVRYFFENNFELLLIAFAGIGLILIIVGIYLWIKAHRLNFKKEKLNVENQELSNQKLSNELFQMSEKDVLKEVNEEVEKDEELNISVTLEENQENANYEPDETAIEESIRKRIEKRNEEVHTSTVNDYLRVENAFFERIASELGNMYELKRNVRVAEASVYSMDILAISKFCGADQLRDLLFDIKYYKYPKRATNGFAFQVLKNWQQREEYEKTFERKAKSVLVIVTREENLEEARKRFDKLIPKYDYDDFEVRYMTTEQLGVEIEK